MEEGHSSPDCPNLGASVRDWIVLCGGPVPCIRGSSGVSLAPPTGVFLPSGKSATPSVTTKNVSGLCQRCREQNRWGRGARPKPRCKEDIGSSARLNDLGVSVRLTTLRPGVGCR